MSRLSAFLVALHCAVYVYIKIGGAETRPLDFLPNEDTTVKINAETEYRERDQGALVPSLKKRFNRLPGVCRRLKRRRITILCNTEKFCSPLKYSQINHICSCPKRSKCTHFFLWTL